jgi:hypothetical protein
MEPKPLADPFVAAPPDATAVFSGSPAGAVYKPLHVERRVKIYPIQEHELTTLSMFSTIVTVCASIASATFGFLLNIALDIATAPPDTPQAIRDMRWAGVVISAIIILACGGVGVPAFRSKGSELKRILSESTVRS